MHPQGHLPFTKVIGEYGFSKSKKDHAYGHDQDNAKKYLRSVFISSFFAYVSHPTCSGSERSSSQGLLQKVERNRTFQAWQWETGKE